MRRRRGAGRVDRPRRRTAGGVGPAGHGPDARHDAAVGRTQAAGGGASAGRSDRVYDVFKGILILVIVAGHNEAIAHRWPALRQVFYYFNVQCFFMLSFVLDRKPFSAALLRDRAVRYLVPYGVFMALAAAAFLPLRGFPDGFGAWARSFAAALYDGREASIHEAVGMRVFWFLPTLFSLVMLRAVWTGFPRCRIPLLVAALAWMGGAAAVPPDTVRWWPLGMASALFFLAPCLAVRWLHDRMSPANRGWYAGVATAVACLCGWAVVAVPLGWVAGANPAGYDPARPVTFAVGLVFPAAMFFALMAASRALETSRLLQACGRQSLGIFLVHMFVYRALTLAVFGRRFTSPETVGPHLAIGLAVFAATVFLSLAAAAALPRWPRLSALIVPRDWAGWRAAITGRAA